MDPGMDSSGLIKIPTIRELFALLPQKVSLVYGEEGFYSACKLEIT